MLIETIEISVKYSMTKFASMEALSLDQPLKDQDPDNNLASYIDSLFRSIKKLKQ